MANPSVLRLVSAVGIGGGLVASCVPLLAQDLDQGGVVTIVWVDPRSGPPAPPQFHFVTDAGQRWQLLGVTPAMLRIPLGQVAVRAQVRGSVAAAAPGKGGRGTPALRARSIRVMGSARSDAAAVSLGVDRYVTLRCVLPTLPADGMPSEATLRQWLGPAYPGVPHLMTEMSRGQYTVDGSMIVGPYQLPGALETYVPPGSTSVDLMTLTDSCLEMADAEVDFSGVQGINIQFNRYEPFAYGGGLYLTRDGGARSVGATWMPSWSVASVYAHEIGHAIGWPHSGSSWEFPYSSCWDVMSSAYCHYSPADLTYIPTHTIALHRLGSGWIAPERAPRVVPGEELVARVAASGAPVAAGAVEIIDLQRVTDVPLTIEARRREGQYESHIPFSGVVMHRRASELVGHVLDIDNNGNPNDQAAVWEVGEVFEDSLHGGRVEVLAAHPDGSLDVRATSGWRLQVDVDGPGTVTVGGTACGASCTQVTTSYGTRFQVVAVPQAGKVLGRWEGNCTGVADCFVDLFGSRRVRAFFGTPISITSAATRPYGVRGVPFQDDLAISGGDGSLAWRVASGQLPVGLTLSASGAIRGTPGRTGRSTAEIEVTSTATSARQAFTFDVFDPVRIGDHPSTFTMLTGHPAELGLGASGGGGAVAWSVVQGQLPPGLALQAASGVLSGTPAQAGTSDVVLEARWDTLTARAAITLVVLDFSITSDSVRPAGVMGAALLDSLRAGGVMAQWSVVSGALPGGVILSAAGVLAGIPAEAGTFTFTARAARDQDEMTRGFALVVSKPSLAVQGVANQVLGGAPLGEDQRRFLDLLGNRNGRVDLADARAWLVDTGRLAPSSSVADAARELQQPGPGGSR